jgi:hypothetical protein
LFNRALFKQRLYLFTYIMLINNKNKVQNAGKAIPSLATEGPLCEKDEQAITIERTKLLQQEAQEKWKRYKERNQS